ncbi:MAG TPA: AsmA family protein [Candidatus Acidoferrales bacterium]
MKRWAKILLAVIVVIVAVAAAIPLFVNANTFRPAIEKQLTTTLGRSVKLGDLSLPIFSGNLVAKDLTVSDDPNFSAAPFLTAKEVRIGVSLKPLIFAHQVNLRSFQIQSPEINVIRAANGTWNFSSIGHGVASVSPSGSPATGAPASSAAPLPNLPDLFVGRIVIDDGRATVAELPAHGPPTVYEHVNVHASDFSFKSQFPFELGVALPAGGRLSVTGHIGPLNRTDIATSAGDAQISVKGLDPVAAGFLNAGAGVAFLADVDGQAKSDGQTLTTNGTIHLQNLKLRKGGTTAPHPIDLTFSVAHHLRQNSGTIQDATIKLGNSAIHITGTYEPVANGAEDPLLKLKIDGQSLPVDELQSLMTAAGVRMPNGSTLRGGTASMNLAVDGQAKALTITGPIAMDNVRLVGFDIGSKIHGIAALSGMKTGDTTEFEKLRVNVRITDAGVVANRIDAVISAMGELTGSGTVSPSNQLDFNLMVKVASASGIGKVGVGLLAKLNGSGNSSGVPLRITGTPDDPYITADVGGIVEKKTKSLVSIFGKKK